MSTSYTNKTREVTVTGHLLRWECDSCRKEDWTDIAGFHGPEGEWPEGNWRRLTCKGRYEEARRYALEFCSTACLIKWAEREGGREAERALAGEVGS